MTTTRQDVRAARDDLATFARIVGRPLTDWQLDALGLEHRITALVSARQLGKSRSLALVALHRAFRQAEHLALIVSASEDAARRLLAEVRGMLGHPMLAGSVVREDSGLVVLTNGSTIRSVPASERAIRGWAVDTLVVDEASLIPDAVLEAAALPTVAARPDARVVMASTPWGSGGTFRRLSDAGLSDDPTLVTHRWHVEQAPWIGPERIAEMRATLSPARFASEVLGQWTEGDALLFARDEIMGAVAPYALLRPHEARGESVVAGCDWGRMVDAHALALVGYLDDGGLNRDPVLYVPWIEESRRPYSAQVQAVVDLAGGGRSLFAHMRSWNAYGPPPLAGGLSGIGRVTIHHDGRTLPNPATPFERRGYDVRGIASECNGVGASPSESLAEALPHIAVDPVHSSQGSKENDWGRVRLLLSQGRMVLPQHDRLLSQLLGLAATPTPSGGIRIEASVPSTHDDLADAFALAVAAAAGHTLPGPAGRVAEDCEWLRTPAGTWIPAAPRPRHGSFRSGRVTAW